MLPSPAPIGPCPASCSHDCKRISRVDDDGTTVHASRTGTVFPAGSEGTSRSAIVNHRPRHRAGACPSEPPSRNPPPPFNATAVPAHRAIAMATIAGARALGKDDAIGSLVPGKAAELIAIDLSALESQPVYDAASQVAFSALRRQVSHVWIAGRPVLSEGELLTVDEGQVLERAAHWRQRIGGEPRWVSTLTHRSGLATASGLGCYDSRAARAASRHCAGAFRADSRDVRAPACTLRRARPDQRLRASRTSTAWAAESRTPRAAMPRLPDPTR